MWLINTSSLQLEDFFEAQAPPYAILSHTWHEDEVTFQEMQSGPDYEKAGYQKIKGCCLLAANEGYEYAWVDTCCIDKKSSAELSDSINSMFRWYRNADVCYAYLTDVPTAYAVRDPCWGELFDVKNIFKRSRWFTRGWTLQELIAPAVVNFFARDWSPIGSKSDLKGVLAGITGINIHVLGGIELSTFTIAERISWAAYRETTRIEDRAYCLMGIFQVTMPLLYGEGGQAFLRLQGEFLKIHEDYTIFSWNAVPRGNIHPARNGEMGQIGLLADDPVRFRVGFPPSRYSDVVGIPRHTFEKHDGSQGFEKLDTDDSPPALSGRGLRICLPLLVVDLATEAYLACLYCKLGSTNDYLCIALKSIHRCVFEKDLSNSQNHAPISADLLRQFKLCTIYIEQRNQDSLGSQICSNSRMINHADLVHKHYIRFIEEGKHSEAEQLLTRAVFLRKRILPSHDPETMRFSSILLVLYTFVGKHEEARALRTDLAEWRKRAWTAEESWRFWVDPIWQGMRSLLMLFESQEKRAEAEVLITELAKGRKRTQEDQVTWGSLVLMGQWRTLDDVILQELVLMSSSEEKWEML